jgi:hypothetical protein
MQADAPHAGREAEAIQSFRLKGEWMLDDPRVNFAISTRGRGMGLDHLGILVEDKVELDEVYARLRWAGGTVIEQGRTSCCYAKSEKS